DVFSTKVEGIKGKQAVEWGLVDAIAPPTAFAELVHARALARAAESDRPDDAQGFSLSPLTHRFVSVERADCLATITVRSFATLGESLEACRALDDAILDLRFNDPDLGTWVLRTEGEAADVIAADRALERDDWLAREVRLFWKRTLKRLDMSARTLVATVTP